MPGARKVVREAAIATVYRHARNDAAAAAIAQDWVECHRLSLIARAIAKAYPEASARARFPAEFLDDASRGVYLD